MLWIVIGLGKSREARRAQLLPETPLTVLVGFPP
jgi:hypothetical protein